MSQKKVGLPRKWVSWWARNPSQALKYLSRSGECGFQISLAWRSQVRAQDGRPNVGQVTAKSSYFVFVSIFYLDENCVCSFGFLPCHKINKTMTYVSQLAVILCAFESCSMCPAAVIFFPTWKDGGGVCSCSPPLWLSNVMSMPCLLSHPPPSPLKGVNHRG